MTDIKTLNDNFRRSFIGGKVMLTQGINAKLADDVAIILSEVRMFNDFTKANDPYGEHDFGSFDYKDDKIFFKIDYYDNNIQYLSPNPEDETQTVRVLTVMLASEY